jgi:hypothetical protein
VNQMDCMACVHAHKTDPDLTRRLGHEENAAKTYSAMC